MAPAAGVVAQQKAPGADLVEPVDLHTIVYHPYPLPDRETLAAREAQARDAAERHPVVRELSRASLAIWSEFQYTPERSYVTYHSWHRQRAVEAVDRVLIVYEDGYHTRLGIDPATGDVIEVLVAPRAPETVHAPFQPEQVEALRIARTDALVQATMAGWEAYPRMIFWRAEYPGSFYGDYGRCIVGGCAEVWFEGVKDGRVLQVLVNLQEDIVLRTVKYHWDRFLGTPPEVTSNVATLPPLGERVLVDHNPVVQNDWDVSYTASATDGIQLDTTNHRDSGGTYHKVLHKASIPNVPVWYTLCKTGPTDYCYFDELCNSSCNYCPYANGCRGHGIEVHSFTNGFYIHAEYFIGCTSAQWHSTLYGCYKYEQKYTFYQDGTFYPGLGIFGPGFHNQLGYGGSNYYVPIYLDFDIAGAASDTPDVYTGSWTAITQEHSYTDGSPYDGVYKWRVSDSGGKNVRIEPWWTDNAVWWALRFSTIGESHPSVYDTNEATNGQDVMTFYTATRAGCLANNMCAVGPDIVTNW